MNNHLVARSTLASKSLIAIILLASLLLPVQAKKAPEPQGRVTLERAKSGIAAELIDAGDYYFHPNGSRINFYRKKDVYYVKRNDNARSKKANLTDRFQELYGDRIEGVKKHRLGSGEVVRVKKSRDTDTRSKRQSVISPSMLKSADSSISEIQPVLANAKGQGDILVTTKLIVKLANQQTAERDLDRLLKEFNLEVVRKLSVPGDVYSLVLKTPPTDSSRVFLFARQIAAEPSVAWAQPQFKSKPYKNSLPLNDPLFSQQWHLQNTGLGGSRCDTDCDASNAWDIDIVNDSLTGGGGVGAVTGDGIVIAVIDDGVQLDHEDLNIWTNPDLTIAVDEEGDGCINDLHGCDFVDDDASELGFCADDGTAGKDGNPSPQLDSACVNPNGDDFEEDNHGTAVAGIAAAIGSNSVGVVGTAFSAEILPIRLISDYDTDKNDDFCARAAEAMIYAGRYADVINNSWGMDQGTCPLLEEAIDDVVTGTLMDATPSNVSKRPNLGSSVLFASGNSASGWVKVTVPVSEGEHAYEWRFLRSAFPEDFDEFQELDSAWLDDITWSDGSTEGFESGFGPEFTTDRVLNSCDAECTFFNLLGDPDWTIDSGVGAVTHSGGQSAQVQASNSDCGNSYLHIIKDGPAGEISFWIWVDTDLQNFESDRVEFLVDGVEKLSFGDLPRVVDSAVGYPASLSGSLDANNMLVVSPGLIAVGASNAGDLSGITTEALTAEERSSYSQYGPELDVLAPSDNQHLGIYTTDRYGVGAVGYNDNRDLGLAISDGIKYTDNFGGTSAATPLVSGIVAAMLAVDPALTAEQVRTKLRETTDKIGTTPYDEIVAGESRNDFYGFGRVNMFKALQAADGVAAPVAAPTGICTPEAFSYTPATDLLLPAYSPQPTEFCRAIGPIPDNGFCVPIKTSNGNVAVICL